MSWLFIAFVWMTRIRAEVPEVEAEYNLVSLLFFLFLGSFYGQNFEGVGTVFLLLLLLELLCLVI